MVKPVFPAKSKPIEAPSMAYSYGMALLLWTTIIYFSTQGTSRRTSPNKKQWKTMEIKVMQLEHLLNHRMDRSEFILRLRRAVKGNQWDDQNVLMQSLFWISAKDKQESTLQRLAVTQLYHYANALDGWSTCCPQCHHCDTAGNQLFVLAASAHECDWYGVTCDAERQVTRIEWTNNGLSTASTDWPPELSLLSNLELLWLSGNANFKSSIPSWISKLTSLKSLSLFHTDLVGELPAELYQLSSLTALRIYGTQLSGTISPQIGTLSNLSWLWLHQNRLTLGIPRELADLTKLEGLTLYGNGFTNNMHPPDDICGLKDHSLSTYLVDCQDFDTGPKCSCCTQCFPTTNS